MKLVKGFTFPCRYALNIQARKGGRWGGAGLHGCSNSGRNRFVVLVPFLESGPLAAKNAY